MVAFFIAVRKLGEGWAIHFRPVHFFFFSGGQFAHTNSTLYTRIGPQFACVRWNGSSIGCLCVLEWQFHWLPVYVDMPVPRLCVCVCWSASSMSVCVDTLVLRLPVCVGMAVPLVACVC